MEQCLRKRGVVNRDRISELPEDLLLHILSKLPTKDVIATSVLSKQWRFLWTVVPRLEFVSPSKNFAQNVGRCLLSHKAPVLESLHMMVEDTCDEQYIGDIGAWVGIAFAHHVREFVLDVLLYYGQKVQFLSSLFCCDTLETLKLKNWIHLDVSFPVSMKSLKTLHLESVTYKDDESICNLLSGCPNLEDLLVHRCRYPNYVMNFVIVSPSLKRLTIKDRTDGRAGGYVVNAPSLKYLTIETLQGYENCMIENAPELVEANIRNISKIVNEKIMGSLKSVKRLSLDISPLEIKCPTSSIFYQLLYLEMHTHRVEWWNLLTLMLESSPKLQVLKLIHKWSEPKYVPQCLLSHLETFVWTRYDSRKEEEKEVATYILRNAIQLKKASFSARPIEDLNEMDERLEMLEGLNGVVRASNSCHLVLELE
ncbi:hypothetical protein CARUB_v10019585mg [Capsella rubella]|uniref:F-box domain-containing protein n=1 Tax=Capsella rubella TaxID=81985 RepID=R0H9T8_9BRAS|nr:hypothetical protein CARUB_v10019585mg [Capsella rubella]